MALAPVVKEAVVAYLLEPGREHVHEEAPDELLYAQRHQPPGGACFFAPGRKSDGRLRDFHNAAVGNGNLMCVAPEVLVLAPT